MARMSTATKAPKRSKPSPTKQGEFIDKEKARKSLCDHLRKLLEILEGDGFEVSDPGAIGYVARTFQMLLEHNPIKFSKSEKDWNLLPFQQFIEFSESGTWESFDEAIGFDHQHHQMLWEQEMVIFHRLIDEVEEKARERRKRVEKFKTIYFYRKDDGFSHPLEEFEVVGTANVLPNRDFIKLRLDEFYLDHAKTEESSFSAYYQLFKGSDIPNAVDEKGGAA